MQDKTEHIHIWHGLDHHHFKQKIGLDLLDNLDTHQHRNHESASHPPGTVVAPMAGLVVKVLVKDGMQVEEGQPMLVMEAMKMEVINDNTLDTKLIIQFKFVIKIFFRITFLDY